MTATWAEIRLAAAAPVTLDLRRHHLPTSADLLAGLNRTRTSDFTTMFEANR